MEFYYIFPLFVLIIVAIGHQRKDVGLLLFCVLLFFSMFRGDNVGEDTSHYLDLAAEGDQKLFAFAEEGALKTRFEILFYLLYYIIFVFHLDPRISIYFFSVFIFVFLYLSAQRLNVNVSIVALFFVFCGFYYYSFNIARQFAAACVGLYGITFINEDSSKRYLFFLWTLLGALLHNSIVVFMILYPLRYVSFDRRTCAVIVFFLYIILYLLPTFDVIQNVLSQTGVAVFDKYGNEGDYDVSSKNLVGIFVDMFYTFILLYLFLFRNEEYYTDVYDNIFLLSLLIMALLSSGNLGSWRLMLNYSLFHCLYIASVFEYRLKELYSVFFLVLVYNYYITIQIDSGVYYLQF